MKGIKITEINTLEPQARLRYPDNVGTYNLLEITNKIIVNQRSTRRRTCLQNTKQQTDYTYLHNNMYI